MTDRLTEKTVAIIPSAGLGRRMGSLKKNFLRLLGRPVLAHTLAAFESSPSIDGIIIAVAPSDVDICRSGIVERFGLRKIIDVIEGGAERQDSVANGLIRAEGFDITVVHDGARPLITTEIIEAVVKAAVLEGAAIAAVPVKDTIKEAADGKIKRTIDRASLVSVQTPQAFRTAILRRAFEKARSDGFYGTDESSLVERLGEEVAVVRGSYENIKITTPEDMAFAESVLRARQNRATEEPGK